MQKRFDIRTLEITLAVIETGSMSDAGTRFGLTQSAVSQAVKRAETLIGTDLLHRTRRPMAATEAGLIFVEKIGEAIRNVENAVDEVRSAASIPRRLDLRLGMIDSFAATVGPSLVKELMDGAMALRLTAWTGLSYAQGEALMRHSIDVAVTSDNMSDLDNVTRYGLFREPYILLVPKSQAAGCRGVDLAAILQRHNFIRYSLRSTIGAHIESHLRRIRLETPRVLEFDASEALFAMVASGVGVAIVTPLCMLQAKSQTMEVEAVPLPGPGFSRELSLVTRRGEFPVIGPKIATLIQSIIRTRTIPELVKLLPWLEGISRDMVLDPS